MGCGTPANFADWTDERLACSARAGSSACFEELVRRFQVPLLRFLIRHVGNRFDAEDLLQEAFVRAYTNIGRYRSRWRFKTWLFTIAHRLSMSHYRQMKSRMNATPPMGGPPDADGPGDAMFRREVHQKLWEAARETLTEEQFTAVWLYYVEDLSGLEIARVLDRSWVSVKTMLHRARRRLTDRLAGTSLDPSATLVPVAARGRLQAGEA